VPKDGDTLQDTNDGDGPALGPNPYVPASRSLATLRKASLGCRGCDLWRRGTQTVFGEGSKGASLVLVGEQPGNAEDLEGRPFVGPAGRLLDHALEEAGLDRSKAYVTNVVKHFKWIPRGKRRIHQKPNARQVGACLPWLDAEIQAIRPRALVCLGATAAQALLGRAFRVSVERGKVRPSRWAPISMGTVHPSSVLRSPTDEERRAATKLLVADLRAVARALSRAGGPAA
jgi:DNA polymerase